MDFTIPVEHKAKAKSKESKNIKKYLDVTRELKKLWNIKAAVIPIVVGALGMVSKGLKKRLG